MTERSRHEAPDGVVSSLDAPVRPEDAPLEALLELSGHPLVYLDTAFRYVRVNRAYAAASGRTPRDFAGRSHFEFDASAAHRALFERVRDTGEAAGAREEAFALRGARADRYWTWTLSPDRDASGRVTGFVLSMLDVTEQVRARGRVEKLTTGLAEREKELRAREEALLDMDRRRSRFLAMLSHELRNPLAPIRNALAVLDDAAPGGESALAARAVMKRQVAHLARLVDDLLDFTRLSHDVVQLRPECVDWAEIVRRTAEDHRALFADAGVRLDVEADGIAWIVGDATRLAEIAAHLLLNAAKFTPAGGWTTVSLAREDAEAVLRVRDSGIGIEPRLLDTVFDPFTQADTSLDRSRGGLGLGLALVRELVELHGGQVAAHSEGPGSGAEFVVRLPMLDAPAAAATPVAEPKRRVPARARRVLLVEDNADSAAMLREVLRLRGHEVEIAYDGAAGLEKAFAFRPDTVLCDIGLPVMDGYRVAAAMRADPRLAHVQLIALSGYALPEDIARSKDAGFDHHLAKPASLERLDELLRA